jgi:hypothetical protein
MPETVRRHEMRGEIVYVECKGPLRGGACVNYLPLDSRGWFQGKCQVCGWTGELKLWWLSKTQRDFNAWKSELRKKVEAGKPLTTAEFDRVARNYV